MSSPPRTAPLHSPPHAPPHPADAVASAPAVAPAPVQRARGLTLVALTALIALCVAWELWLAPTGSGTLAIKALPLLPCMLGLMRHRLYTYRWLSLLVWLYVTEGLVRATSESGLSQMLAAVEVTLAVALFGLCVHYIRLRVPPASRAAAPSGPSAESPRKAP